MAKQSKEEKAKLAARALAVELPETATIEEIEIAEKAKGIVTPNETVENTEETKTSVLSKKEFRERFLNAIEKFLPEVKPETEEEAEIAKTYLSRNLGLKISHLCTENTQEVIESVRLMIDGEYQNDKMLVLIEEMPEIGYGHG